MNVLMKIDQLRENRGWSLYRLGAEADLTPATLSNMYSRGTNPSLSTLTNLCNAFGITLAEFFSEEDGESLTTEELNMLKKYRSLTDEEKDAVKAVIDVLSR